VKKYPSDYSRWNIWDSGGGGVVRERADARARKSWGGGGWQTISRPTPFPRLFVGEERFLTRTNITSSQVRSTYQEEANS
jgi:hypothetical protein